MQKNIMGQTIKAYRDKKGVSQEKLAALGREDIPALENIGRLFSDEVQLTCG